MYIIGLTGSIGSGKSTAATMLKRLGIAVHSADDTVHALLKKTDLVEEVKKRWPSAVFEEKVDRKALAVQVFSQPDQLAWLEKKLYPHIQDLRKKFLISQARRRVKLVALDIPLLFEKKLEGLCDTVVVVSCSSLLRTKRLLKRKGMTSALMNQILQYQLPSYQKQKRADHILHSGLHQGHLFRQTQKLVTPLFSQNTLKWSARWGHPARKARHTP